MCNLAPLTKSHNVKFQELARLSAPFQRLVCTKQKLKRKTLS
jgi:hypothetical protein